VSANCLQTGLNLKDLLVKGHVLQKSVAQIRVCKSGGLPRQLSAGGGQGGRIAVDLEASPVQA
jgi:hypothetical protein